MRLGQTAVLPDSIQTPRYDRNAQHCGIVHFGLGAFHRAHQAVYTDDAMNAGDQHWGIMGVSLRSPQVAAQLNPQNGLYTVTERSRHGSATRLIGAVQRVLVAPADREAVIAQLADPNTHVVSFTMTEKAYRRGADGRFPDFCALLAQGFERRRRTQLGGLTLVSCDNLPANGRHLSDLLQAYLGDFEPWLADWFVQRCCCPSTMVDRIVPAVRDADLALVAAQLGVHDNGAILTEAFRQWVIEDRFAGPRPAWEAGGAQFTQDVQPFETAKLRMLNGAHSALAYMGLALGHQYVHQAIRDAALRPVIERLMRQEAAPSVAGCTMDLDAYADALIERFDNPALAHSLLQIAMDGSQKIRQRWLGSLAFHQSRGETCDATLCALAAWLLYVRGTGHSVEDPQAAQLAALWREAGTRGIVRALFGAEGLFCRYWVADENTLVILTAKVAAQA